MDVYGCPRSSSRLWPTAGDLTVDFFGGSNTSGPGVAEDLRRRWLSFELDPEHAAQSVVRFMGNQELHWIRRALEQIAKGKALAL